MKKVKILRLSIGGYFMGSEKDLCEAYCREHNCTYRTDYIYVCA